MSALETVDLAGVEILAADVTIHGRGSPPEGDRYSVGDLRAIASANRELETELRPPAKIGHGKGGPRVGTLANVRVAGDKLLADVRDVPRRFADLVRARAYDGRSVELSRFESQRTGKRYDLVVSALAWLGDQLPAVHTLDDVAALYADGSVELLRMYELDTQAASSVAVVDAAIERGAIRVSGRDAALKLYASAPRAFSSLIESHPGDAETAFENRRELSSTPTAKARDLAERTDRARRFGIPLEDVI